MNTHITKEILRLAAIGQARQIKRFRKRAAIHKIKMQPFFGDYFPKLGGTITWRRPAGGINET